MSACAKTPTDFSSADVLSSKETRTAETESNTGSKEEISTAENETASDVSSQGVPSKEREEHQENTNSYDDYNYDFQYTSTMITMLKAVTIRKPTVLILNV